MSYERAAQIAEKASIASGGGTVVAGVTLNEWAILIGIAATIVTTLLNWYYKHKHFQLAKQRGELTEGDADAS